MTLSSGSGAWSDLKVSIYKQGEATPLAQLESFTIDGKYNFAHLHPGTYEVRAELDGYAVGSVTKSVNQTKVTNADITLLELFSVSGEVTVSGGTADWESLLVVIKDSEGEVVASKDDFTANGEYTLTGIPWATGYKVAASMTGFDTTTTSAFQVKANVVGKNVILPKTE